MPDLTRDQKQRQAWMSRLAKAPAARLAELMDAANVHPAFTWLQPPEVGAVMVRGRAGGTGAQFNMGEMSVTRCTLTIDSGEVGHGYVQGRDKDHARRAAMMDAMMQTSLAAKLRACVLDPIEAEMAATRENRAQKAAATKVEFFTMVRGED